jgi:hypothetical protein
MTAKLGQGPADPVYIIDSSGNVVSPLNQPCYGTSQHIVIKNLPRNDGVTG